MQLRDLKTKQIWKRSIQCSRYCTTIVIEWNKNMYTCTYYCIIFTKNHCLCLSSYSWIHVRMMFYISKTFTCNCKNCNLTCTLLCSCYKPHTPILEFIIVLESYIRDSIILHRKLVHTHEGKCCQYFPQHVLNSISLQMPYN